jgi:hypothetical protein
MRKIYTLIFVFPFIWSSCAFQTKVQERTTDEAMLNFLPYLNQKVAGYLDEHTGNKLDSENYKEIVDEVCGSLPSCGKNAKVMFDTYDIKSRSIDGIFSVMLCEKETSSKVMEDFSCNEQKVEIRTFQSSLMQKCGFEPNWRSKITADCPIVK